MLASPPAIIWRPDRGGSSVFGRRERDRHAEEDRVALALQRWPTHPLRVFRDSAVDLALLRMRQASGDIEKIAHPEEAASRPSGRTHRACPAQFRSEISVCDPGIMPRGGGDAAPNTAPCSCQGQALDSRSRAPVAEPPATAERDRFEQKGSVPSE